MTIQITIDDAEEVSHNLADLLCWWDGFKDGMRMGDHYDTPVAQNGVDAARKIKEQLSAALINERKSHTDIKIHPTKDNLKSVDDWVKKHCGFLSQEAQDRILKSIFQ